MSRRQNFAAHAKPIEVRIEERTLKAQACRFKKGVGWCLGEHLPIQDLGRQLLPYLSLNINVSGSSSWPRDGDAQIVQSIYLRGSQSHYATDMTRSEFKDKARRLCASVLGHDLWLEKREFRNGNVGWDGDCLFECEIGADMLDCRARLQLWLVKSYQLANGHQQEQLVQMSDLDAAYDDLSEALKLNPDSVAAYRQRAMIHIHRQAWDQAIRDLDEAIIRDGNTPRSYLDRAGVRLRKSDWHGAIEDCTRALELDPESEKALLLRANALLQRAKGKN